MIINTSVSLSKNDCLNSRITAAIFYLCDITCSEWRIVGTSERKVFGFYFAQLGHNSRSLLFHTLYCLKCKQIIFQMEFIPRVCFVCAKAKSCNLHCELWLQIKPHIILKLLNFISHPQWFLLLRSARRTLKNCFDEMIWSLAA